MANELSRLGDRLPRAREGARRAAAGLWIRPPARREPSRPALPRDIAADEREQSDSDARQGRSQSTVVAIHVEVRHAAGETTAQVIDARIDEPEQHDASDATDAVYDEAPQFALHELPAFEEQEVPIFAAPLPRAAAGSGPTQAREYGRATYVAVRARSAYLTHLAFSGTGREPRLLDLRV